MQWLSDHWMLIISSLLAVFTVLGLWFPSIGGILSWVIKVLKALAPKAPSPPEQ